MTTVLFITGGFFWTSTQPYACVRSTYKTFSSPTCYFITSSPHYYHPTLSAAALNILNCILLSTLRTLHSSAIFYFMLFAVLAGIIKNINPFT